MRAADPDNNTVVGASPSGGSNPTSTEGPRQLIEQFIFDYNMNVTGGMDADKALNSAANCIEALFDRYASSVANAAVLAEYKKNRPWMKRLCDYVDEWDAMAEYDDRIAALDRGGADEYLAAIL